VFIVGSEALIPYGPSPSIISRYDGSRWLQYGWPIITGVWASSATNAIVVGQGGRILHFDGTAWRAESSGTGENLADVWGSDPNNVFAVGGSFSVSNGTVISSGVILHYDGTGWSSQLHVGDSLHAVWGSSSADVYAIGANGILLHYDGLTWTQLTSRTSAQLLGIWGRSPSDIYAVGPADSIWHYDGKRWTAQLVSWAPGLFFNSWGLSGVWGSDANNVIAVGALNACSRSQCLHAVMARRCGGSWTGELPPEPGLTAIWGSSAADIYAVGDSGVILRRDGKGWVREPVLTEVTLTDVWGAADGTLFAVGGGSILRGTR